ncbi:hypothetical protein FB446DRAFT_652557 [Lentinula raphanica]|uniref:Uncharacterized protein n=1 Tax=Lentinula raphanica TaxID=153919 RepID=A0AA38NVH5_9AGAR|nr:hypothetical protein FB446DRAFT_652557 [Lentinula raphanica]KAJ3821713.1 hypothetical protein F5880DRAFT_1485582 [Lentinula raphanica]KAJ3831268.1 hypothetical protein F5878DRAFT_549764 [Lentinula raphanica]
MLAYDIVGGNYDPFWAGFPLTNINLCIAPDVLHQLYQGVFKHLVTLVQNVVGEEELDERIQRLPPTPGVRRFPKGISNLSQVSGTERKHVARILLACLNGKMEARGIIACRSILHFIQLAQYPSHDKHTLQYMTDELNTWHTYKDYFIEKGARAHFKIPKFHSLLHYVDSIKWLGTTDNYNTEAFERLHIDLSKEGWRASNKRNFFPQMLSFISRQEKVSAFDFYKSWTSDNEENTEQLDSSDSKLKSSSLGLAKYPKETRKKIDAISFLHGAPGFVGALKLFLNDCLSPGYRLKKGDALKKRLPFTTLGVWHNFGLVPLEVLDQPEKYLIKAQPLSSSKAARFDTVLVLENEEAQSTAVQGK